MTIRYYKIFLLIFSLLIISCGKDSEKVSILKKDSSETKGKKDTSKNSAGSKNTSGAGIFTLDDFYKDNHGLSVKAEEIFNSIPDSERVAQMIITSAGELGKSDKEVMELIKSRKIGGILILKGSKTGMTNLINKYKEEAALYGELPLLFSCDAEPTLINNKYSGIQQFLKTNSIKSEEQSKNTGLEIANEIKKIGFNQNYAPVCDFDINKEIIGDRSFGHNEGEVVKLSNAFIAGTQSAGIIATAKHFPGHGNVKGDSHKELVWNEGEPAELNTFRSVIQESGVISIMAGHIAIKGGKYNTDGKPSTISNKIITGLLKNELKFRGIVVTDAMNMGGVKNFTKPALSATIAGCDMILMPTDEKMLVASILAEMKSNEEYKKQIYESVKKIIRLKICLGLIK